MLQCQVQNLARILDVSVRKASDELHAQAAYLNAYLPASLVTQSFSPVLSFSAQIWSTCPTGPTKTSSSFFMTSAPAVNLTVLHSLTSALIVHRVLIKTVAVLDEVAEPVLI